MIAIVNKTYTLPVEINVMGDTNIIKIQAVNVAEAIRKFRIEYPTLTRLYVTDNIKELSL